MTNAKRFILSICMLAACATSGGCYTALVYEQARPSNRYRLDEVASLDGAWAGDGRLVIAFHGWLKRPESNIAAYEAPTDPPTAWWFETDLDPPTPPNPPHYWREEFGKGAIRIVARNLIPRSVFRRGVPPPNAIAGLQALPVHLPAPGKNSDAFMRGAAKLVESSSLAVVGTSGGALYAKQNWSDLTFYLTRKDSKRGVIVFDCVSIEYAPIPLNPWWCLLFPVTVPVDLVLLPFEIIGTALIMCLVPGHWSGC
jgi:hypothetical protein